LNVSLDNPEVILTFQLFANLSNLIQTFWNAPIIEFKSN